MNRKIPLLPACVYAILQIIILFFLRKIYLLTVYQTVAFYGAIVAAGIALVCAAQWMQRPGCKISEKGKKLCTALRDAYVVCWSGVHGVIVLGFLTYGTYNLTLTQVTIVQIVNLFLGVALFWIFYMVSGRVVSAIGWGNLLIGIIGTTNYYLVAFRGAPFQLSDIKAARTAANVVQNYDFTPSLLLVACLADLIVWYVLWRWGMKAAADTEMKGKRWNLVNIAGTIVVAGGCAALPIAGFGNLYQETQQFTQENYLATLLAEMMGNAETLPEDYSVEAVQEIVNAFAESENVSQTVSTGEMQKPHIIVIMNEAFSDLRVLGDFETTQPVLDYWDSLQENVIRGWANVSVLGGTTANSEYEFLTSDATGVIGGIPYNQYFTGSDVYPGMVSVLKAQGYEATAFHPYHSSGWNRMQVYRAMQFDNIVFMEDVEEQLETMRNYVSDKADYAYIIEYFEQNKGGGPQLFFNVTMQNHGGYTYDNEAFPATVQLAGEAQGRFPQAEQYLTLMHASDEALQELLTYFSEYEEPVVVVLFGDHQPRLEDDFYEYVTGQAPGAWSLEQKMKQYKTPFIIWHNYEVESQDIGDVSLNYLAAITLQSAGLTMSGYQSYVLQQYEEMPVITTLGIKTADGQLIGKGEAQFAEMVREYRDLVYNHTVDKEGRLTDFFQ